MLFLPTLLLVLLGTLPTTYSALTLPQTTAFLHLDLLAILISTYASGNPQGESFITAEQTWLSTIHSLNPPPAVNAFTRLYFNNPTNPEIGPTTPFGAAVAPLLPLLETTPATQISPLFPVYVNDTVLVKTRYYAGAGNQLEIILKAQGITHVVLSGLRTSGVVLSTAYRLYDLDFDVVVVSDCTLETPVGNSSDVVQEAILGTDGILSKLGVAVVSLEEAVGALGRWGK
jgi:nicotinamidase-related amidase